MYTFAVTTQQPKEKSRNTHKHRAGGHHAITLLIDF